MKLHNKAIIEAGAELKIIDVDGTDATKGNVRMQLTISDLAIGAVEIKDSTTDTRAVVGAGTVITEAGNALGVKDASIGLTTDADTALTVIGRLKKILATMTDGTAKSIMRSALKGATAAADLTSKNVDANTQALHVAQSEALPTGTNEIGKVVIAHDIPNWSQSQDSAANAAQTITKAAGGGAVVHYATGFEVVLSAAAAGADISIELKDGVTVIWKTFIGSAAARGTSISKNFSFPIAGTANTAMTLLVSAGGAAAVTTANLMGYSR